MNSQQIRLASPSTAPHRATDVSVESISLYFLPVTTRMPLKFGTETLTSVTCVRAQMTVVTPDGRRASGWGETPLSVQWVWPSDLAYEDRHDALKDFCMLLAENWVQSSSYGHPMELGYDFQLVQLPLLTERFNGTRSDEPMPYLAALVCLSAMDIALHDAYGNVHGQDIYSMYNADWMTHDLARYLEPAEGGDVSFDGRFPGDYLVATPSQSLVAWHLVGGLDPLEPSQLTGEEPEDGYPTLLPHWIETDGLKCLKIKLRGNDADWDYQRLVQIGQIAIEHDVNWLSADFNCTVEHPQYVLDALSRLCREQPRIYGMILYVEQPFPYDLEASRLDVHCVSAHKPLFLDESAHDWHYVRLGRQLGWSGVALKTCKTQTGALLSLCWAKAHGMPLMVQDLTNPMLAQVPHVRLAAHAGTIMGVETNGMQFYPDASAAEAAVHPGLYRRRNGHVDLSTISGPGFGYRLHEIQRQLPPAAVKFGK
jgi:L-alanine-DL-glutamate epimerase-like enolase superfamily enzyme